MNRLAKRERYTNKSIKHLCFLIIFLFPFTILYSKGVSFSPSQGKPGSEEDEILVLLDSTKSKFKQFDLVTANAYAQKALVKSRDINNTYGIAYSALYMAQILDELGHYEQSLKYLLLAERESYSKTDAFLMSQIYFTKGKLYATMRLYDKSLSAHQQSLQYANKITNLIDQKVFRIKANSNIAFVYSDKKMTDSCESYLLKTQQLLNSLNESSVPAQQLTYFYTFKGLLFSSRKEYDSAIIYFKRSLKIADKYKYKNKVGTYLYWGAMSEGKMESDSALNYYLKALNNSKELNFNGALRFLYPLIADTYSRMGNLKKAQEYKIKGDTVIDEFTKEFSELHGSSLDNLVLEQEKRTKAKTRNLIFILILCICLVTGPVIYYVYKKQRKAKEFINFQGDMILKNKQENYLLEKRINVSFDELLILAKENNPEFITRFQEIYPEFISNLLKINDKLQIGELTFCALLYLNFSSKDIAQYTFVTPRAVQLRKNRLRKKLNIPSDEDIYLWIKEKASV